MYSNCSSFIMQAAASGGSDPLSSGTSSFDVEMEHTVVSEPGPLQRLAQVSSESMFLISFFAKP